MARADHHKSIRDAIAADLITFFAAQDPAVTLGVVTLEDVETDWQRVKSLPAVFVSCIGPEQRRPEFDTNRRDGMGFPVLVALVGTGVTGATASDKDLPDLTAFRSWVFGRYNQQRVAGVDEVGYCEVSDSGGLYDKDSPMFQRLQTAVVVLACGRFPRV